MWPESSFVNSVNLAKRSDIIRDTEFSQGNTFLARPVQSTYMVIGE